MNEVALNQQDHSSQNTDKIGTLRLSVPPKMMLLIMAVAIFTAEVLVMVMLGMLDLEEYWVETLLDSTSLLLILTPVYLFFYRPFWVAQKQHEKQIQYLSQQLLKSAEEERKRITSELHDHSGQALTALQFGLQTLKRCMSKEDGDCNRLTDNLIEQTSQLSDDLRSFASRLRPETLDQLGLVSALEVEFKDFSSTYRHIELEHRLVRKEDLAGRLSGAKELAIYRVCQEALTNIVKYAEARQVKIELQLADQKIILQVEDDGVGFDVNKYWFNKRVGGIGLLGMRERISQLKGRFTIDSAPGEGTLLTVELPLAKE